jgi:hypothetical protein
MRDSLQKEEMAGVGPVSDTSELLREVDTDARLSYYGTASSISAFFAIVIVLLLAISVVGLWWGVIHGYVIALGGAFGLVVITIWIGFH